MHLRHIGRCFPTDFDSFMSGNVGMLGLGYDPICGLPVVSATVSDLTRGSSIASGVVFQMRWCIVAIISDKDNRCAVCSLNFEPSCRFYARRHGCLATGINKDSGRWAQKLVVAPKRVMSSTMCNNLWNIGNFHLDGLSVGISSLHIFISWRINIWMDSTAIRWLRFVQ